MISSITTSIQLHVHAVLVINDNYSVGNIICCDVIKCYNIFEHKAASLAAWVGGGGWGGGGG